MQKRFIISRVHLPFLLFLFLSFFYVFCPFSIEEPIISADAVYDAQIAKNIIWDGKLGWQATLQPPFQAILTAIVYPLTSNVLTSGILVSKFMLWLLPISVYLLALRLFGIKTAFFSAVLVFFHPHYSFASAFMEPTLTYTTLLMMALFFSWEAFSRKSFIYAVVGGLFFSFAYLARSEGFLILVFMNFALLSILWRKNKVEKKDFLLKSGILLVVILTFFLVSAPYLFFLKDTYGKIVISPKSSYVQEWMKSRTYKDNNSGEILNPRLWGLNDKGKLKWQEPKGAGDLLRYLASHPAKNARIYLTNLSKEIPGRIGGAGGQQNYPQVYPLYFVLPAFLWLAIVFIKRDGRSKAVFMLSPFLILFVLPIYTAGWWKYLLPYAPLIVIMAVAGFLDMSKSLKMRYVLSFFCASIILYSVWAVKSSAYALNESEYFKDRQVKVERLKKVAEWTRKSLSGHPNYMTYWSKLVYYLDGRWTALPVASLSDTIAYARKHKVDYIVREGAGVEWEIEMAASVNSDKRLIVAAIYRSQDSDYRVVFFKVKYES